jgi:hypothetical protein
MILTSVDIFLNSLTSVAPNSKMLKNNTLSHIPVKEKWMKTVLHWFGTLHPVVQVVLVICSFILVMTLIFNRDALTNFLNILPWFLALLSGKKIHKLSSISKTKSKSKSGKGNVKD